MTLTKSKYKNLKNLILPTTLIIGIILLVINPQVSISHFYNGVIIWAKNVMPAILPFLILSKLLTHTSFVKHFGNLIAPITKKVYGVPGISGYIYAMSIISGYPLGAKLTSDIYQDRLITKDEAIAITSFTSTSGPLFVIGTIGVSIYHSMRLGMCLFLSHLLGSLLNGLLYRNKNKNQIIDSNIIFNDTKLDISVIIFSSTQSILTIGGFIAISYMFVQLLIYYRAFTAIDFLLNLIGVSPKLTNAIIASLIEITTGGTMLNACGLPVYILAPLLAFFISFGGLSIHGQAYTYLSNFEMPYSKFLLQKFTHALISAIISIAIILMI